MRIFCIGRTYAAPLDELQNEKPDQPVIFSKPDTALVKDNLPVFYPDFTNDLHYEVEIVVKISKMGKNIEEKFAHKYYDEIGLGVDFTARDLQSKLKAKGLPWDLAKGFDGSAPISAFVNKTNFDSIQQIGFSLNKNNEQCQFGNTSMMLWNIDQQIAFISKYFTLRPGDLLFTGTPEGVGPVVVGDRLTGFIEKEQMFDFEIK
jgi:2-keto-4-pentenoate hydratase/2-oxohepta-3-ene-1,7-dioic acid hydratase in catechol pathway